jgi:hypothetical protein
MLVLFTPGYLEELRSGEEFLSHGVGRGWLIGEGLGFLAART